MSPHNPDGSTPAWLRHWEDLHILVQIAVVAPVATLVLWGIHITMLNQPTWRGLSYGVFWGALATAAVVGASRSEKAKREARARALASRPGGDPTRTGGGGR